MIIINKDLFRIEYYDKDEETQKILVVAETESNIEKFFKNKGCEIRSIQNIAKQLDNDLENSDLIILEVEE